MWRPPPLCLLLGKFHLICLLIFGVLISLCPLSAACSQWTESLRRELGWGHLAGGGLWVVPVLGEVLMRLPHCHAVRMKEQEVQ